MERIYLFLIRNDVWIFALCVVGLIWYLNELRRARRILRGAMFGLEREKGQRMQRKAATFVVASLAIIALVIYVNSVVAPGLPPELLRPPTPTPNIFATPLVSPSPPGATNLATPTLAIAPTVTLSGSGGESTNDNIDDPEENASITVEQTLTPTPPALIGDCIPEVVITSPPNGVTAAGLVTFFGTATADGFASYNLEAFGPQTSNQWIPLLERIVTDQVRDAILGTADFSLWEPGLYSIRLTVRSIEGVEAGSCVVQLNLESPNS